MLIHASALPGPPLFTTLITRWSSCIQRYQGFTRSGYLSAKASLSWTTSRNFCHRVSPSWATRIQMNFAVAPRGRGTSILRFGWRTRVNCLFPSLKKACNCSGYIPSGRASIGEFLISSSGVLFAIFSRISSSGVRISVLISTCGVFTDGSDDCENVQLTRRKEVRKLIRIFIVKRRSEYEYNALSSCCKILNLNRFANLRAEQKLGHKGY